MNAYIEENMGRFVVCQTRFGKRYHREIRKKITDRFNVFGERLESYDDVRIKYQTVIEAGVALSSSYPTIEQARAFIKKNRLTETYGPHTVFSVDL